ncbi:unnamed protein product [Peronospora effusa]|uniref:RRM domain-containing protein n=1 Tax=Peronospora effusa TaxID=542832 RepID=A0A3M6VV00_9STRA|nr:hypothetical protein DD238_006161 [Peronospora effusa]CAI5716105.1 unnamed protein product [Peronospora effusa]
MGRRRSSGGSDEDAPRAPASKSHLPWGMEKKEMQPSSLTSLTDDKLARFVLGHQKKTKFQKEREDREAKKRQADEEAAMIYATFVASFDNEDETKGKTFVRAAIQGDRQSSGEMYRLKSKESDGSFGPFCAENRGSVMNKKSNENKGKETEQMQLKRQIMTIHRPKKRRAIDEFLEEMKERGPAPVSLEGAEIVKGSFDDGNPDTTNLYVGNLAPTITEEVLEAEFGRFGEVYSVKIMWPRSEEERARKRNCGFVSFYERRDADDARVNLDNKELEGQPMIVGWGKAVKIPPRERTSEVFLPSAVTSASVKAVEKQKLTSDQTIRIEIPNEEVRRRVDHLAHYVATDGLQFENGVRMREANNTDYDFLFKSQSTTALYYRWRVYSLAMGDDEYLWRKRPFQMTDEGPVWIPPDVPSPPHKSRKRGSQLPGCHDTGPTSGQLKHNRSGSYGRNRSQSSSPRSRRFHRRSGSGSCHRSRSGSFSSDGDRDARRARKRCSRSRSRSRCHRSHSRSSDKSSLQVISRRSRCRDDRRRDDSRHERSRQIRHVDGRSGQKIGYIDKTENLLTGQQIARARDMERGRERNRLSGEDYDDFKELLGKLTLERESVKETMGFALDKSEAAVDLVNIILESFKSSNSSGVTLIGLLYVTSDILHNSSAAVKNASLFRTMFQECLPEIMDTLRVVHKNIVGRMSANAMKEKVMNVLSAWGNWSLFPPAVLLGLHASFLRKVEEDEYMASSKFRIDGIGESDLERLRKTCRQSGIMATGDAKRLVARLQWLKEFTSPAASTDPWQTVPVLMPGAQPRHEVDTSGGLKAHTDDVTAKEIENVTREDGLNFAGGLIDEENLEGDSIDGEPIVEDGNDIDGEPMDEEELDGEPFDPDKGGDGLDGESLDGEDFLDGIPMDEGMDGGSLSKLP